MPALLGRDMADTLREALAPGTVTAGAWALGLTLGLGLRRELVPDSRVSQTSELSPSSEEPEDSCLSLIWSPKHKDQVFVAIGIHLPERWDPSSLLDDCASSDPAL